jgi:hypothetical protein
VATATSTERRTTTLGLLAAPGLARDLADELAEELPKVLGERYPDSKWQVAVQEEPLAAASALDVDLFRVCRERMLSEGWDVAICLTELPLLVGHHPVTAHASIAHGVGLVSVPALGPVGLGGRVEEAVLRLVDSIVSHRAERPEIRFVAGGVRGNLRLLLGMVRANRPWRLIVGLSRAGVAALGAGAFGLVSPGVWHVADGLAWPRLVAVAAASVLITVAALILAHRLWEHAPETARPEVRENVVLFNLTTTLTVVIGVLTLFVGLLVISTACAAAVLDDGVVASELGHDVGAGDYVKITTLVSTLATIGGALGSALESDRAVREAAYGYRPER